MGRMLRNSVANRRYLLALLFVGLGSLLVQLVQWRRSRPNGSKTLWIVNHYAVTGDMPGGTRHLDLGNELSRAGWNTKVFASNFNHNSHEYLKMGKFPWSVAVESVEGVSFEWLPTTPYTRNDWRRYLNMLSFLVSFLAVIPFRSRPTVIVGSSAHLLAALGAWMASRFYRVPFILEIRDVWPDSLIQLGLTNRFVIALLRWVERHLYRNSDEIIGVSQGIVERIASKGISPKKITLVAHGIQVGPPCSYDERRVARIERGWQEKIVAIWAGSLQPFNGLDTLIDAAARLQDCSRFHFVLIGDGSEREKLKERAKNLRNVRFYDSVPKSAIWDWLIAADIGVLTARKFDAFTGTRPRKIFDYMSAGLPIVCTIPGEARDIISAANAGVFAKWEDPDALASAFLDLAADAELRQKLGANGREVVERDYSISTAAQALIIALSKVSTGRETDDLKPTKGVAPQISTNPGHWSTLAQTSSGSKALSADR